MAAGWRGRAARLGGALASGALVSVAIYPSWLHALTGLRADLGPLAWIALVPLFLALRDARPLTCLPIAVLWELAAFGLATCWGGSVSWAGWVAGIAFFLPHHVVLILLLRCAVRRGPEGMLLASAAFVCHEFARARLPIEVPWAYLSHSQIALPTVAVADLGGAWLVTGILVAANYSLFFGLEAAWGRRRDVPGAGARGRRAWIAAGPALLALAAVYGLGRPPALDREPGPMVGIVQGDMPVPVTSRGWWDRVARVARLARDAAREGAEIIVVSESAVPLDLAAIERGEGAWVVAADAARRLVEAGTAGDRALLVQTYETDRDGRDRNSAVLFARGARIAAYHKVELVPFGEYVPLRRVVPLFERLTRDIAGQIPDVVPGGRPRVLRAPWRGGDLLLGPLICFESTFPRLAVALARDGAQILVNQANDRWFFGSAEPEQAFRLARLRAIECRRPCVRSTNVGISGWIDADGRVLRYLERDGRRTGFSGAGVMPVPLCRSVSFYALAGDWFPWLCALGILGQLLASRAATVRRRRRGGGKGTRAPLETTGPPP